MHIILVHAKNPDKIKLLTPHFNFETVHCSCLFSIPTMFAEIYQSHVVLNSSKSCDD